LYRHRYKRMTGTELTENPVVIWTVPGTLVDESFYQSSLRLIGLAEWRDPRSSTRMSEWMVVPEGIDPLDAIDTVTRAKEGLIVLTA
jgi:hypothetical protein